MGAAARGRQPDTVQEIGTIMCWRIVTDDVSLCGEAPAVNDK